MSSSPATISIGVVDNQEFALHGLRGLVAEHPDLDLRFAALDVESVDLTAEPPTVLVLDLFLGRDNVMSTPWIPRLDAWGAAVLLHTSCEFPVPLREAVAAGAAGLSLKNDGSAALLDAIRAVAAGEFACTSLLAGALLKDPALVAGLTARERDVVTAVSDGLTHQQTARRHDISAETVKEHLQNVRSKYLAVGRDVGNAHTLTREARRDGWIG